MMTFLAHQNVTIKRLTRCKQKVVLAAAAMLEGKSMPSNMAARTNLTTLSEKSIFTKGTPVKRATKTCNFNGFGAKRVE